MNIPSGGNRWDERDLWDKSRLLERLERYSKSEGIHKLYQGKIDPKIKYPRIQIGRYKYLVHRISAYIFFDLNIKREVPLVLHKRNCPYKNCWGKDCLYLGNQSDNMKDAYKTGSRDGVIYRNQHTKLI